MCFRPGGVDEGPFPCPGCGKTIQPLGGMKIAKCPFCHIDLDEARANAAPAPGAPAAPAAPGAPSAPSAPTPPAAPTPQG